MRRERGDLSLAPGELLESVHGVEDRRPGALALRSQHARTRRATARARVAPLVTEHRRCLRHRLAREEEGTDLLERES